MEAAQQVGPDFLTPIEHDVEALRVIAAMVRAMRKRCPEPERTV